MTANNAAKTYDGLAYNGGNGVSYAGFVNGEGAAVLGGSLSYGGTAQGAVNAGSYSLTASGLASNNYAIAYQPGTLSVGQAALTVTALNQSKTYGTVASLGTTAFTTSGLVNGDTVTNVTLISFGSSAAASVAGGPYAITATSALGNGLSNYTIGYANGLLTVNPSWITVTALGGSSTYGSSPSNPELSATGLQNGQSASVLTGLSNSFGVTNASDAGGYTPESLQVRSQIPTTPFPAPTPAVGR